MHILVVDDDPSLNRNLQRSFTENDHDVEAVETGEQAIQKILHEKFDLVILDLMLPGITGWEVLSTLRQCSETSVIVLSAISDATDKVKALENGADDYVSKPFLMAELNARINSIVRRTYRLRETVSVDGVVIDRLKRRVINQNHSIELTNKEMILIDYLIENRGIPVNKAELASCLRGKDSSGEDSNLIEVYVSSIRSKINKNFIRTARGRGYFIP